MDFIKHILNKDALDKVQFSDIEKLVKDKTEEFLHLDYEQIPAKNVNFNGLAEHISGFLNTSGGLVIFGVSEDEEDGRDVPQGFTWTSIDKEQVENSLYRKVEPWNNDIRILPIQDPDDLTQRIFIIYVPKSKNPPHMVNHRYYLRINFQTIPMEHNQVLSIFRQSYIQRQEHINKVYGPLYNEFMSYLNWATISPWGRNYYSKILREGQFLLSYDPEFAAELNHFYNRISEWNKAVEVSRFRLPKIINAVASSFFNEKLYHAYDHSSIRINIKAESIHQLPHIDQAVLNDKDPVELWKQENPFAKILYVKIELQLEDESGRKDFQTSIIDEKAFKEFLNKLAPKVQEDTLIAYIRDEFEQMKSHLEEYLLVELEKRM